MKPRIAFVVQRYGTEVIGGAETECREYAERLAPYYNVEILTTCARDYTTWENAYKPGTEEINGVTVRRFSVDAIRDMEAFNKLSEQVIQTLEELQQPWVEAQGPVSTELIDYLKSHGSEYQCVLFMTYLYYTTVRGMQVFSGKSILIPTAHDEWPIYLPIYKEIFAKANGYIYNAPAEKRFVEQQFPENIYKSSVTVGSGVTIPAEPWPEMNIAEPYICYCGRIDKAKGCDVLFQYFIEYKKRRGGNLKLVLTGNAVMDIPEREDILYLGFVSEKEKFSLMRGAKAFVLASHQESLSIVLLESMAVETPVLVNERSEVLKDHCLLSNGGLYFENYYEFEAELGYLLKNPERAQDMGKNGKKYVEDHYRWDFIVKKLKQIITEVSQN